VNTFTVFNKANDEWICIFHGTEKDVIASLDEDMAYVSGSYPYDEYEFINGNPVAKDISSNVMNEFRTIRNAMLLSSDWTQLPDAQVDKQAWTDYRQALRDLPNQYQNVTDLSDVVWPQPPVI
jgi:hypothetical protein